jgi:ferric-dicitrate binding protein FerR (iron transport regulator)
MSVEDEAAHWFAVLRRGVMTLQERSQYETWIANRANRAALAQMEDLWLQLEDVRPARTPALQRPVLIATVCAASIGMAVLAFTSNSAFWTGLDWANR